MPYVGSDGQLTESKPFGISYLMDLFWRTVTFFNLYVRTLLHLDDASTTGSRRSNGRNGDHKFPGRRMGGMSRISGIAPPPCGTGGG